MSLNISNVSFGYPAGDALFDSVSLSVAAGEKASLVGDNGTGKSTLLKIINEEQEPSAGEVIRAERLWFVPQHFGQYDSLTVAGALGIEEKLRALQAILGGSASEEHYASLGDSWNIGDDALAALAEWDAGSLAAGGLESVLERRFGTLSGGEKTRVFLAGIRLHSPALVLMDEPTNHLDAESRRKLYALVGRSRASMLIVSHDRALLNLVDTTWELSAGGVERYGGNYEHYKALRGAKLRALDEQIAEKEKALRLARRTVRETLERQARRESDGAAKAVRGGIPRIMLKTLGDSAAATVSRLSGSHAVKVSGIEDELRLKREERSLSAAMKIRLSDSGLHRGKTLVAGTNINFGYGGVPLWEKPFSFRIDSGDRLAVRGGNGCGKTTLAKLILGELEPSEGEIFRSAARILCIDQQYSLIDNRLTVIEQASAFNGRSLPEHIVRTELHRFLFPSGMWDRLCSALSGGEKMKLIFCSMIIGDCQPDMLILDEPANNLDIRSLEIVASALKGYRGTIAVISHDEAFIGEVGVTKEMVPGKTLL